MKLYNAARFMYRVEICGIEKKTRRDEKGAKLIIILRILETQRAAGISKVGAKTLLRPAI